MRSSVAAVVILLSLLPRPARAQDPTGAPQTLAQLETKIREILAETKTPAAGIAIVARDSVLWVAGLGTADVASGRPATPETLFRIGSVSKAFVSLLVLLLEEEGRLRLQDPLWSHAPEIQFKNRWAETDPVRIVHLLEHATGWDDLALRDYALDDSTITLREGLDYTPRTRRSRWRPGTLVSYCNSGPPVAAYVVEKIAGRPFADLVRERLFGPIGMTTATYVRPPAERMATLYHADGETPQYYWHISLPPAGAINASPRDMARYVRFLLNRGAVDGQQLLPPDRIVAMEKPRSSRTARSGLALGYGLHLATYVDSGFVWVGHDGGVNGGLTTMAYRPDQGVGFAAMINTGKEGALERMNRAIRDYLTRDQPRVAPPRAPISALARERTGLYRPDNPRVQKLYFLQRVFGLVQVSASDSALTLRPLVGKPTRYVPVTDRLFRRASDPVATLALLDTEGERTPAIERMGYLLPTSYHRAWAPFAWIELAITGLFLLGLLMTALFSLVWVPRWLFRRLRDVPRLRMRAWPLVATLAVLVFMGIVVATQEDVLRLLGNRTAWSLALFGTTLAFPVAAVAGLVSALRAPPAEVRRGIRWYCLAVSAVFVIIALYLAWWGIVGWRSWA